MIQNMWFAALTSADVGSLRLIRSSSSTTDASFLGATRRWVHRCLSGPRHALPLPVYVLAQARGVGWHGGQARSASLCPSNPPEMGDHARCARVWWRRPKSHRLVLAVTLPEVSTLPTSATTRRASSTQRRGLINCSEQISVAQRRTAALLLHARCPDA